MIDSISLTSNNARSNSDYLNKHIGKKIRMRRLLLNKTLCEVACKIDISYQQIQKYEKGKDRISASVLYELSEILNTGIEYFYDGYKKIA